jgi:hypothetical protein
MLRRAVPCCAVPTKLLSCLFQQHHSIHLISHSMRQQQVLQVLQRLRQLLKQHSRPGQLVLVLLLLRVVLAVRRKVACCLVHKLICVSQQLLRHSLPGRLIVQEAAAQLHELQTGVQQFCPQHRLPLLLLLLPVLLLVHVLTQLPQKLDDSL